MRAKPISVRFIGLNTKREAREGVTLKAHIYYIHQTEKCKVGYLIIIYSSMQNNKHLKQIYETAPNNTHGFFIARPMIRANQTKIQSSRSPSFFRQPKRKIDYFLY